MKVWIVWADNGQAYEENRRGIWAVCSSKEAAKKCIADAPDVIYRNEKRDDELQEIRCTVRELTKDEINELNQIYKRDIYRPWCGENNGIPYFSIEEFELIS